MGMLAGVFCLSQSVYADSLSNKDFSLRLPAALSRFSTFADVAGVGGASAGSKWQTSVNPASMAWQSLEGAYKLSFNPQYSAIIFEQGTVLNVVSESATKDLGRYGTLQVSLAQVFSNERANRQEVLFGYDMNYLQLQWGKRLSNDLAVGLNLNYASSEVSNKLTTMPLAESSSDTYGFRGGVLYQVVPNLLAGVVIDYAVSLSSTTYYDILGLGIGNQIIHDRTKQFGLRVGPSYEYAKDSTFSLDYSYNSYLNDTGSLDLHRFHLGVEQKVWEGLFVRGGYVLDGYGNSSLTSGLGVYPSKQFSVDLGYQYSMFPEIQPEFGRSHVITVSLSLTL